jgi:hypothetical protein
LDSFAGTVIVPKISPVAVLRVIGCVDSVSLFCACTTIHETKKNMIAVNLFFNVDVI